MKIRITLMAMLLMSSSALHAQTIMNIYKSNGPVLQIPLNTIDSITYTIPHPGNLATLNTLSIANITSSAATSGGNITNNGGTPVTQRGVVWNTSPNPSTANSQSNDGSGNGNFTSNLTGLTANITYYVRAYATNSAGTAYGNGLSFTTTGIAGSITALNCSGGTNNDTLTAGTLAASGVSSTVLYTGGNGGTYGGQTVSSTGVTGLTAKLTAGTFASGSGSLTYTITGMPISAGTASFALNIGGQNCTLSRTVNACSCILSNPGTGVTFNGYTYPSVILGNGQEFMSENLRTTIYANGDPIPNVSDSGQWISCNIGAWADYKNDSQYENPYGKLYNIYAVADPRNVCPAGWHVPTEVEWNILINYLDSSAQYFSYTAGGKMKSTGTQYWTSPNQDATNESGLSFLPAGCRAASGGFYDLGNYAFLWSSTVVNAYYSRYKFLMYSDGNVYNGLSYSHNGNSVRCLRD